MIRLIEGLDRQNDSDLLAAMFESRRRLFADRLRWKVDVDDRGWERDRFDGPRTLYLISMDGERRHQGSLRLLPTTGETMLNDAFSAVFDGQSVASPVIWECTRFCVEGEESSRLTPAALRKATAALLLGMCEVGLNAGIKSVLGVVEKRLLPAYRDSGWPLEIVGEGRSGRGTILLGVWYINERSARSIRSASGMRGSILDPESRARAKTLLRAA